MIIFSAKIIFSLTFYGFNHSQYCVTITHNEEQTDRVCEFFVFQSLWVSNTEHIATHVPISISL